MKHKLIALLTFNMIMLVNKFDKSKQYVAHIEIKRISFLICLNMRVS